MFKLKSLFIMLVLLAASGIQAQNSKEVVSVESSESFAIKLGKTEAVRDLVAKKGVNLEKKGEYKKRFKAKTIPNFYGRGTSANSVQGASPKGYDAVHQGSIKASSSFMIEPKVNVEGMESGAAGQPSPPDPDGAIGKDYFVQMVNATAYQVFDKEGNAVSGIISMNTIWSAVGSSSDGDPIVFFDQESEQWFLTEFNVSSNAMLIAVSETSDPLGSYYVYEFSAPQFPDYPKYSIWSNAIVITTNEGGSGNGTEFYVLDRQALLNGDNDVSLQRHVLPNISGGPGFFVATPVDWIGSTPPPAGANPMVMRLNDDAWGASDDDIVEVWEVDIDWDDANNTELTKINVLTAPYDSDPCSVSGFGFSCIPQLNGGGIDGLQEIIMNQVKYRNFGSYESMVLTFVVDYTGGDNISGIRWIEMRRSGGDDWSVYQEGTFAPEDGKDRFMPSIAMDASGNIGLAYSISSDNMYPGLAFTGRKASDPLGEMTVEEYIIVEGSSAAPNSRYGDYACMTVDPVTERDFWFTAEYMKTNNDWGTMITAFEIARDTFDMGPVSLNSPVSTNLLGATETVTVNVKNFGIETIGAFSLACYVNGVLVAEEPVSVSIATDEEYAHTFVPTVDMSALGDYDFELISIFEDDQSTFNDTLRTTVRHEYDYDAAVNSVNTDLNIICGESVDVDLVIMNAGFELMESAVINIEVNGVAFGDPVNWTGALAFGETETLSVNLTGLADGNTEITAIISSPNGELDQNADNDSASRNVTVTTEGLTVSLELFTDFYPEETTWEVLDENGEILYEGGPYASGLQLYTEEFCLLDEKCYTFVIYDSYNDGLFVPGTYSILDEDGNVLTSMINGNFGEVEFNEFCLGEPCVLTAEASSSPASSEGADDGSILVNVSNGSGPFTYSIDGGSPQDSNLFEGLAAGVYTIQITDNSGCETSITVTVEECALSLELIVTDESENGLFDGSIEVNVTGYLGTVEYSLDEGQNWQSSNLFDNLGKGIYVLTVRDSEGCESSTEVVLNAIIDSVRKVYEEAFVKVLPNPTNGLFTLEVSGVSHMGLYLPVEVIDGSGKIINHWNLVWYDDMYTSQMSIFEEPAGIYYIRYKHPEMLKQLTKIVKQ